MGTTTSTLHHVPLDEKYDVVDFQKSDKYMQYKYTTLNGEYMNIQKCDDDQDLLRMLIFQSNKSPCFLENEVEVHMSSDGKHTAFNVRKIPNPISITESDNDVTNTYTIDSKVFSSCDGIYDIWLRDCKNVKDINIEIEGIGSVYSFKLGDNKVNNDIQVPLNLDFPTCKDTCGTCETVKSMRYIKYNKNIHISFLPSVIFNHNKIKLTLNKGSEAKLVLSTVYLSTEKRRELIHNDVYFKIEGKQYFYPKLEKSLFNSLPTIKQFQVRKTCLLQWIT